MATDKKSKGLSKEEIEAMKERLHEMNAGREEGESEVMAKIAKMPEPDKSLSKKLHAVIKASAPDLTPRTWYGMPAYSNKDDKVVCFFQPASKFKTRYLTLGFSDKAKLDDGEMWPVTYAVKKLTSAEEKAVAELVKKAVSG